MEQHRIGIVTFARRYIPVLQWLIEMGWEIDGKLIRVDTNLTNRE